MSASPDSDATKRRPYRKFLVAFFIVGLVALGLGLGLGLSKQEQTTSAEDAKQTDEQATSMASKPWPHQASDIPPDPKVRFGTLENGLRYMVMPNAEPPEKLAFRLHIDAGSLMEAEDQRGLVRFVCCAVFAHNWCSILKPFVLTF